MHFSTRRFESDNLFSKSDIDYVTESPSLRAFYVYEPSIEGLKSALDHRKTIHTDRSTLVASFLRQYKKLDILTESTSSLISALSDTNTFTVTTAHQPVLFTGPVYFIYKAVSAIVLAQKLQSASPKDKIIPVFVLGGEDHDKEEINHLHLFNKKIEWVTDQEGSCGRYSLENFDVVLKELFDILGDSEHAADLKEMLTKSFHPERTYGEAMQHFIHLLLGQYGLLVLNMDDIHLKKLFQPILKDEILHNRSQKFIAPTQNELENLGYKSATYLRDINLFYLSDNSRERIEKTKDKFFIHQDEIEFSEDEFMKHLEEHPERFSPNVNMRPIYQELILPNVAYIGGGGELAYWLERRKHFEFYNIPYPVLIRRDSAFWIDRGLSKKMIKLQLDFDDFVDDIDTIISNYIAEVSKNELTIDDEKKLISTLLQSVANKGASVDPTLKASFEAESVKILKSIDSMASRIFRAEKHKHDNTINQLRQVKEKLFPEGRIQERHDNFMAFYLSYGRSFFDILLDQFDPLLKELKIIRDDG